MKASQELILLPEGHSFRLIQWKRRLDSINVYADNGEVECVQGVGNQWHYHQAIELTFFQTGMGSEYIGDSIGQIHAGDLVLIGSGVPHYWNPVGRSSGYSLQWYFPENHAIWKLPESKGLQHLFQQAQRGIRYPSSSWQEIRPLVKSLTMATELERFAIFMYILAKLAGLEGKGITSDDYMTRVRKHGHGEAIQLAVGYILANYRENVRLEEVLDVASLSKPTFCRNFKQVTGKTFSQFIAQTRLQSACHELSNTDESVISIAFRNGYNNMSLFNRQFLREYGCSPSVYRRGSETVGGALI